jgi:mannose-6-phosphate isomerase-like protein (cupin superfamily)
MSKSTHAIASALSWLALVGCSHAAGARAVPAASAPEPAVVDGLFATGRLTRPMSELIAGATLAQGEGFRIVEVGRDANSSHHIVTLRDREPVHRHDLHDLFVVLLEGSGQMLIGEQERALGAHSVVYVPRGTPHAMRNTSAAPIVGYAVFVPAFDGSDRVLVEPAAPAQ